MGPFSFIYIHRKSFLWILLYFLLAFLPSAWFIFSHNRQYVTDNWAYLKTKPLYAPFAGFVRKKPGESVVSAGIKNILGSLWSQIKVMFGILMKPFRFIIEIVHTVLKSMAGTMDIFRQQMAVIRKFLQNIVQSVMGRLEDLAASFINIFFRLRDMLHRSFATFKMVTYMLETMAYIMKSMMGGPVGTMMRWSGNLGYVASYFLLGPFSFLAFPSLWHCVFCFGGTTPILMSDGSTRPISQIRIGDKAKGGLVTGILQFQQDRPCKIYRRDSDIVTSSHPVWYQGRWIWVEQHPEYHVTTYQGSLYCLVTEGNRINTPTATYLDWDETGDNVVFAQQKHHALQVLNKTIPAEERSVVNTNHVYQEGFSTATLLYGNNPVTGSGVWSVTREVRWYILTESTKGPYVTGSTLVQGEHGWTQVCKDPRFTPSTYRPTNGLIYHVKTSSGVVTVNGITYRDLMEHPSQT